MSDVVSTNPQERALLQREGLDTLGGAFDYSGGERLSKGGLGRRERIRLRLTDETGGAVEWYLKRYHHEHEHGGLLKCCCAVPGARPSPARRELENIRLLRAAGVPTMRAVACGERTNFWGAQRSYIVLTAVPGDALERCFGDFLDRRGGTAAVEAFNDALVGLVARLHLAGLVHRDLYASHIFLEEAEDGPKLYLIDLARVFRPRWRRFRWRVKDLAELKYSMPAQWVDRHWRVFLEGYLARIGGRLGSWAKAVDRKVAGMRRRKARREKPS